MPKADFVSRSIIRQCNELEDLFIRYKIEVQLTVIKILREERNHLVAPTNVQQKIQNHLEDLGTKIELQSNTLF